jgi:type IX secretion system PorP/SprF family membrane protein
VKKILLLVLVFNAAVSSLSAQVDPHFSQFYAYPLWLNPGMTGVMNGSYRITGIYRNQWSQVMTPYNTAGLSADFTTNKNINIGVNFMNQQAGDAGYQYLNAYSSISYSGVRFGKENNQVITMGMQLGLLSRKFDPSKFQFGDQWNPITGYNPGATTADIISHTSSSVFDMGAGISYTDMVPGKLINLFGGVGVFHLTRPQDPFVSSGLKKTLPARYSFHGGARIHLNDRTSLTPNFLYLRQGNAEEKVAGLYAEFDVTETVAVLLGANYRYQDAISPYVGLGFQNFIVGISYDINNSDLGKTVKGTNSLELSVTYNGRNTRKPLRYLSCPRF